MLFFNALGVVLQCIYFIIFYMYTDSKVRRKRQNVGKGKEMSKLNKKCFFHSSHSNISLCTKANLGLHISP